MRQITRGEILAGNQSASGGGNAASPAPQPLTLLSKLILGLILALIIAGVLWHGISAGVFERIGRDLMERPVKAMSFRFILQPAMAVFAATHDGRKDVRLGRSAYFATILLQRAERIERLREGLNATARIIFLGIAMDAVYQEIVLHRFYPDEAVIVALTLAFVPYLIARGLVTRIMLVRQPRDGKA